MLRELGRFTLVSRGVLIEVEAGDIFGEFIVDIDDPVGGHPGVTTIGLLEDVLLGRLGHSVVVELSPLVVKPVLNEYIIMPGLCVTIVHTYRVQMIRMLVQSRIGFLNL